MNLFRNLVRYGRDAWNYVASAPASLVHAGEASWRFITSLSQLTDWVWQNPFKAGVLSLESISAILTGNTAAIKSVNDRINAYVYGTQTAPLDTRLERQLKALARLTAARLLFLYHDLVSQLAWLRHILERKLSAERQARRRGDQAAEAYARKLSAAVRQAIEKEAASAYDSGRSKRLGLLARVLETAAGRVPLVAAVTRRVAGLLLDVAAIDNPVARVTAGWLIRWVIARLGIDKAIGDLAGGLSGPLLGDPAPRTLGQVIISQDARLQALEAGQAQFMDDGGPQILQAGQLWKHLTGLGADAALLGFAAAAVLAPEQTAADLAAIIRPVGTATISAAADLLAGR